jgi:hypothetical protein
MTKIYQEKRTPNWFVSAALHSGVGSANLCSTAAAFKPDMAVFLKAEGRRQKAEGRRQKAEYRIQNAEYRIQNSEP